jgi:hypothetical protein
MKIINTTKGRGIIMKNEANGRSTDWLHDHVQAVLGPPQDTTVKVQMKEFRTVPDVMQLFDEVCRQRPNCNVSATNLGRHDGSISIVPTGNA